MQWTDDQRKVIESRDCSILVSAAAGSGKTAVLTQRIVSKVTDPDHPIDVDRLLVVTFTKAAAAQMRERIGRALEEELARDPGNVHLQRQSTLLHNAYIMTIDSFCLKVVRSHFQLLDLDPAFQIGNEEDLSLMKDEACEEVLEQFHARSAQRAAANRTGAAEDSLQSGEQSMDAGAAGHAGRDEDTEPVSRQSAQMEQDPGTSDDVFLKFYRNYATAKSDDKIRELMVKLYEFSQSHVDPEGWLRACTKAYRVGDPEVLYEHEWMQRFLQYLDAMLSYIIERYKKLIRFCNVLEQPEPYLQVLYADLAIAEQFAACNTMNEYFEASSDAAFARWSTRKKTPHDELYLAAIKAERDRLKKELQDMQKKYFSSDEKLHGELIFLTGRMMRVLVDLTLAFAECFSEKKRERNLVDFSDIEHFALQILLDPATGEPTAAAAEYRQQFDEVMIDEYQDSNNVQEALLVAVSGLPEDRENYFMVGDVKQSIYRFRLARPELFLEKYKTFQIDGKRQRRIDLHANFRSRPEVIDFVNRVFTGTMRGDIGNIEYDADAALRAGASFEEDGSGRFKPEILLLPTDDDAQEALRLEAILTARRIRDLVMLDMDLSYKDIVILMRAPGSRAAVYQEILSDCGVPVIVESETGFFAAREIELVLNFLSVIDNPLNDIPLAAVLTSYFGDLTAEELALIRTAHPAGTFYEAVFAVGEGETDAADFWRQKVRVFLELLRSLREKIPYTPVHELLEEICHGTGFYHYAGALPAGRQRQANLDRLFEMAVSFEQTGGQGLHGFCSYLERLIKRGTDFGEAGLFGEDEDAVRIMSIHKSKGLEFPVVFVAGLGNKFNKMDLKDSLVFHADLGCGLKYVNREARSKADTLLRQAISIEINKDNLGEELRVLYVAMTRAEKKLILTGKVAQGFELPKAPKRRRRGKADAGGAGTQERNAAGAPQQNSAGAQEKNAAGALERNAADAQVRNGTGAREPGVPGGGDLIFDIEDDSSSLNFYLRFHAESFLDFILPAVAGYEGCIQEMVRPDGLNQFLEIMQQADKTDRNTFLRQTSIVDDTACRALNRAFSYRYAYANESLPKQKVSVSEIKHRAMEAYYGQSEDIVEESVFAQELPVPYIPRFVQEREENRGALYGTAVHEFLRHFDYGRMPAEDEKPARNENVLETEIFDSGAGEVSEATGHAAAVPPDILEAEIFDLDAGEFTETMEYDAARLPDIIESEISRIVSEGRLDADSGAFLNRASLLAFFRSDAARRIRQADAKGDAFREQPFTMTVDAARVWPDTPTGREILTQGIIDIFWIEEDGIVLLDYKTDRVKTAEELIGRYKTQLLIYAEALGRFYPDLPVKEILIYSFRLNRIIPITE